MNFTSYGDHYLQIGGEATGTSVASNYANLFMDRFKTKALDNWRIKLLVWLRFIDDIFIIWTHGESKLIEFITYMNSIHPTIRFTYEFSTEKNSIFWILQSNSLQNILSLPPCTRNLQIHICICITHLPTTALVKPKASMFNSYASGESVFWTKTLRKSHQTYPILYQKRLPKEDPH